ncbi:aminoglycoside 6-adenylyltransferase [Brevibacillus sp. B_LB10_24]|uniref:aminoglycoside 6-adenylyltransferase n=1 Tax=Brevibacillus sp. B_LB10_24 TaxID=3380645 RepID=UPI0038BADA3D
MLQHLHRFVRPMLFKMLEWQAGIQTDFSVSIGKSGKYLEKYLSADNWQQLLDTYPEGSYEAVWEALFTMGDLFQKTAQKAAAQLQYEYPLEEARRVMEYLRRVRELPPDAAEIF